MNRERAQATVGDTHACCSFGGVTRRDVHTWNSQMQLVASGSVQKQQV